MKSFRSFYTANDPIFIRYLACGYVNICYSSVSPKKSHKTHFISCTLRTTHMLCVDCRRCRVALCCVAYALVGALCTHARTSNGTQFIRNKTQSLRECFRYTRTRTAPKPFRYSSHRCRRRRRLRRRRCVHLVRCEMFVGGDVKKPLLSIISSLFTCLHILMIFAG